MKKIETNLDGCFILEPNIFEDSRGYFFESYNEKIINEFLEKTFKPVQDNQALSHYGIIRGLHLQKEPYAQAKLVRVVRGAILDIAVDLRKESKTYKQKVTVELTEENKKQLFIPKGFAHGYAVISKTSVVLYKTDNFYVPKYEQGIRFNDPDLNIDWKIPKKQQIISEKDKQLPYIENSSL